MIVTENITHLKESLAVHRKDKIVFVPTMGNLHAGHLSLIETAQRYSSHVVVSIFVNPLQFGPSEDFETYPRTLEQDIAALTTLNVPFVFTPKTTDIYPDIIDHSCVTVPSISDDLCGKFRPGFFNGVATIVTKLFNIVQPDIAIFGEKDYQQLQIIKKMTKDLCFPLEIIGAPTIREADGLAMSSRNQYLSSEQRLHAKEMYCALSQLKTSLLNGDLNHSKLITQASNYLEKNNFKMDYIAIRNQHTFATATSEDQDLVILMAGWLGRTRLIDNMTVNLRAIHDHT